MSPAASAAHSMTCGPTCQFGGLERSLVDQEGPGPGSDRPAAMPGSMPDEQQKGYGGGTKRPLRSCASRRTLSRTSRRTPNTQLAETLCLMHHKRGRWTPFLQMILLVRREGAGMSDFEDVMGELELVTLASGTCRWSPSPQGEWGQETGASVALKPRARADPLGLSNRNILAPLAARAFGRKAPLAARA